MLLLAFGDTIAEVVNVLGDHAAANSLQVEEARVVLSVDRRSILACFFSPSGVFSRFELIEYLNATIIKKIVGNGQIRILTFSFMFLFVCYLMWVDGAVEGIRFMIYYIVRKNRILTCFQYKSS